MFTETVSVFQKQYALRRWRPDGMARRLFRRAVPGAPVTLLRGNWTMQKTRSPGAASPRVLSGVAVIR